VTGLMRGSLLIVGAHALYAVCDAIVSQTNPYVAVSVLALAVGGVVIADQEKAGA
jgi:hypothetical protein